MLKLVGLRYMPWRKVTLVSLRFHAMSCKVSVSIWLSCAASCSGQNCAPGQSIFGI